VQLIRDITTLPDELRGGALAIGNFDGVHRGHARLVERLVAMARRVGGPAVVFTFDPSPTKILHPEMAPERLSWPERRAALLARLGVDAMVAYPTDRALLTLTPETFFQQVVLDRLTARAMVEGSNFRFGRRRSGDIEQLQRLCTHAGLALEVVEPIELDGGTVSSSRIRALLAEGQVDLAAALLTEPYRIRGIVSSGSRRGESLGYPTANVEQTLDTLALLPADGIYAGHAHVNKSQHPAAISIGPNPTFHENVRKIEVFLLDFQGNLYGQPLEVDFISRLRDIVRFDSPEQLVAQMARDVEQTRRVLDR